MKVLAQSIISIHRLSYFIDILCFDYTFYAVYFHVVCNPGYLFFVQLCFYCVTHSFIRHYFELLVNFDNFESLFVCVLFMLFVI